MINRQNVDTLTQMFKSMQSGVKSPMQQRRDIFELIDKYLEKESDQTTSGRIGARVNRAGNKAKIRDTEVPVAFIQAQTAKAYLAGIFLGGEPIFSCVSDRNNENGAAQLTALMQRDQHRLNWRGEMLKAIGNAVNYNLAPIEVVWTTKRASSVKTVKPDGESTETGAISPVVYEGQGLTAIDPYNFFGDQSVEPHELHEHGSFCGYYQKFNYVRLKRFVAELENLYIVKHNLKAAFSSNCGESRYFKPNIRPEMLQKDVEDWSPFFGENSSTPIGSNRGRYDVATAYVRLIPKEFGLDLPKPGQLKVMKLIFVNDVLLYMEPLDTPHEFLPIVVGQVYRGPWDKKSFTEYVTDLQDMGTSMLRGSMDSMRRAVQDRGIYDPTRIRKMDIDSDNPVSKIPVTTNAYNSNIRDAYFPIPYEDRLSPNMRANLGLMLQLADQTTGQNQSAQGNFIKGNKTRDEFDTIMSNAQARMQLGALEFHSSAILPMQHIMRTNYLVYAEAETLDDRVTGQPIEIDPVLLRTKVPEFKMADGILPATKIANTDILLQSLQLFAADQTLTIDYDIGGIVLSVLKQEGFTTLDQYKRTDEQKKQFMANVASMNPQPQQK